MIISILIYYVCIPTMLFFTNEYINKQRNELMNQLYIELCKYIKPFNIILHKNEILVNIHGYKNNIVYKCEQILKLNVKCLKYHITKNKNEYIVSMTLIPTYEKVNVNSNNENNNNVIIISI